MELKFLTDLGIAEESAQKILQTHNAEIGDVETLKKSVTDWESKYTDDLAGLKLTHALDKALASKKSRDNELVTSLLDKSKLTLDEKGVLGGLEEQLKSIQAEKAFLFDSEETTTVNTGMNHAQAVNTGSSLQDEISNALFGK